MYSLDSFVAKANKIHNNAYDYSHANYINSHTKVEIRCPKHGPFHQTPTNHLGGNRKQFNAGRSDTIGCGCPSCGAEARNKFKDNSKKSIDNFIRDAIAIHGKVYDYSKSNYVNTRTRVEILCPIHGSFFQTPVKHISGTKCPKCAHFTRGNANWFQGDPRTPAKVYLIQFDNEREQFLKIGITSRETRFWKTHKDYNTTTLFEINTNQREAADIEKMFKEAHTHFRYLPLTKFHGWTECFNMSQSQAIKYLKELCNS